MSTEPSTAPAPAPCPAGSTRSDSTSPDAGSPPASIRACCTCSTPTAETRKRVRAGHASFSDELAVAGDRQLCAPSSLPCGSISFASLLRRRRPGGAVRAALSSVFARDVILQVLPFAAGAHLAIYGGFAILGFEQTDPDLGYVETLAGELFLESPKEIDRLNLAFDNLRMLSLSPAGTTRLIRERGSHG